MKKYLIIFTERFPECYEGTRQYCKTVDTKAEVKEEIRKLKESPFTVSFTVYQIGEYGLMTLVIIAANVIQNEAVELFKDYLVFATRLSKNSFVGVNQSKQTGKTGPDTADRLFNLIKKRY